MAKQHRMAIITISAILDYVLHLMNFHFSIAYYALILIVIGSFFTTLRRLNKIIQDKEAAA